MDRLTYYDRHSKNQNAYSVIREPHNRRKEIDVHELQKKEMLDQTGNRSLAISLSESYVLPVVQEKLPSDSGESSKTDIMKESEYGFEDTYLYFDSDAKESTAEDLANGILRYSIVKLNQNNPLKNIIEMQLGNFYIPEITTGANFPLYFFYKRVNILIEEMKTRSIRAQDDVLFHFEMDVQPSGIANLLTPAANEGKFIFRQPFRDITSITFRFRAPIKPVVFEQDIFEFTAIVGTSPARITTTQPHGLTIASLVSIFCRNFTSDVGNIDPLINSVDGHLVTVIDANILEFPAIGISGFDFTGIGGAIPGELTVGFRRIAFSMRFRSLTDLKTNQITAV